MPSHVSNIAALRRALSTFCRDVYRGVSSGPSCTGSIAFGPVPSRRLGRSLGINNIRLKECSYDCVYCQVGPTTSLTLSRDMCLNPYELFCVVKRKIALLREQGVRIDYISFVPNGEPTLDLALAKSIRLLRELGYPVAVFTNSSLLWNVNVKEDLLFADYVSVKIDAVTEGVWESINRPHPRLQLGAVLDGVGEFADSYRGVLTTETMLVRTINDSLEEVGKIAQYLGTLRRSTSYFATPVRPPAQSFAVAPAQESLSSLSRFLGKTLVDAEMLFYPEGNEFEGTADVEDDILGILAVHPMSEEAIKSILQRKGVTRDTLRSLIAERMVRPVQFEGKTFYVRYMPAQGEGCYPAVTNRHS